jgi:hypothetical protein
MKGISNEAHSAVTPILACGKENWDDSSSLTELNDTELHSLVALVLSAMQSRDLSPPLAAPSPTSKSDIYSNTRFKQVACAGLSPKHDGSPDNLIPTQFNSHPTTE